MKPQEEKQKFSQGQVAKPRFKIEKLEERIAPKRFCNRDGCYTYPGGNCHYNANAGKYVGCGKP